MVELIVAVDENFGIGYRGKMPWNCKEDLQLFKNITINSTLVMGRKTIENMPVLKDRQVICLSKTIPSNSNVVCTSYNLHDFIKLSTYDKIFIAGGAEIYKIALESSEIKKIHLSVIKGNYECDKFFDIEWIRNFIITKHDKYKTFDYYILERNDHGEKQYLELLKNVITNGIFSEGRNGSTLSTFVNHFKFDLRDGFPLLTTKKMFLRGIIEELLFFLKGETDTTLLSEKGIHIWDGNTSEEFIKSRKLPYKKGVMGPLYGRQWRFFNSSYKVDIDRKPLSAEGGIDQLENVIKLIKEEPKSRRILMTTYNPEQAEIGVLYPCHSIVNQFYVENEYLDMYCYNRSQDLFLGVPFNIASSSLLLIIIAKLTNKVPRFFYMSMGDTHIYSNHIKQVGEQLKRIPFKFPTIKMPEIKGLECINKLESKDFELKDYISHSSIKAEMSV